MRTSLLAIVGALGFGAVAAAACGFPEVDFAADDASVGSDATLDGDSSRDATAVDAEGGIPPNPDVDPEGGKQDATTIPDGGGGSIDAGPDASCCDCDTDQFKRAGGACALPAGDCDDLNPFIKPNQGFVASPSWESSHVPTHDWDCDGTVIKQYPHSRGSCSAQLKLSNCANFQNGFQGDPQCGQSGKFIVSCIADQNVLNLNCTEAKTETRIQGCH